NLPSPAVGQTVTYTITLVNNGPNAASNITVSAPLPSWLTSPVATPIVGTTYSAGVWTIAALPISTTSSPNIQTLTITGTLNSAASNTHTATITHSDQYDSIGANNTASVTIPLIPPVAVDDTYAA